MSTAQNEYLELLAQADLLLLVSQLLDRPSESVLQACVMSPEDRLALIRASGLPDPADLAKAFNRVSDAVAHTNVTRWSDEHCRLFEATVVCPINESAYVRRDKGALLSDVCGFYIAFGFSLNSDIGEKADHLIGELQFFSLLFVMYADAIEQGHEERAQITRGAVLSFAHDHLGEWILAFCDRLSQSASLAFYQHTAMLLALIWRAICERHGVLLNYPLSIIQPDPDPDVGTPYECGMAEGCGAKAECGSQIAGSQ